MMGLEEIKKRFFKEGYDFTEESEVAQCFEDMEWLIDKVSELEKQVDYWKVNYNIKATAINLKK